MAKKLSALPVGAKVKDVQSTYRGKPIIWTVADKNHSGYPAESVTLITEKIIALKAVDAKEPNNSDSSRKEYGNNRYRYANIVKWLNSEGSWYSAQHSQDAPPSNGAVAYNPYDSEPGFLTGVSQNFKAAVKDTNLTVVKASVDGGGSETTSAKFFLASTTEVGLTNESGIAEGSKLALFTDDNSRKAYPTAEAVSNSNYTSSSFTTGQPWYWWLRTPYASNSCHVRNVSSSGALNYNLAYYGIYGVRPLCNLKSEILVSDTTDSDGAYRIEWNKPPTTPSGINIPSVIRSNKSAEITWGASTDPEGGSVGYQLERKIDSGSWSSIYRGINRNYTDTITKGWVTVAYRVKAYDNHNAESSYQTGPTRTIVNNEDPVINTGQTALGQKTGPFNVTYSVSDSDAGQTLTAKEYIDAEQKRSHTVVSGQNYSLQVVKEEWQRLLNGAHTLKIEATDSEGGAAEKIFNFTKNETEIEVKLKNPLPADDRVTKAIVSVVATIPQGATMTAEVCNNGNDAAPAWEDATQAVLRNQKIFIKNATKTASKWGFNVRVKVKRNGAVGDCFIESIGGNYE